jgi:hypothetical protein
MTPIEIKNLSSQQFINQYAKPGCIGLVGGSAFIDESIKKMQKNITKTGKNSLWSHAFIFNEVRQDDNMWVVESDLEFHKKQIKLGVQENRASKYFNKKEYPNLAILNFNLTPIQQKQIIGNALNLVADKAQYSIREIFGVLISILKNSERNTENNLAQNNSFFCSAMVQHCYLAAGLNLNPTITTKQLTPQDIAKSALAHTFYQLIH